LLFLQSVQETAQNIYVGHDTHQSLRLVDHRNPTDLLIDHELYGFLEIVVGRNGHGLGGHDLSDLGMQRFLSSLDNSQERAAKERANVPIRNDTDQILSLYHRELADLVCVHELIGLAEGSPLASPSRDPWS